MKIIKVSLNDITRLAPLFDGYMVFYRQESNEEQYAKFLKERIKNKEAEIFMAIDDDGSGMGFTLLYPTFSSVSQARVFTLNDLYVDPDHRKKGVASALMTAAGDYAKMKGAVRLHLETEPSNTSAQALYEKESWVKEGNFFYYRSL